MKLILVILVFISITNSSGATQVLAPNLENVEGNGAIRLGLGFNIPSRVQVIYGASLFNQIAAAGRITELRLRVDGTPGNANFSSSVDLQVNLSTTTIGEESMSSSFAMNVGQDDTVALPRTQFTLSSQGYVSGGPSAFDVVIPLTTPFLYTPSQGNLLLDLRAYEPGTGSLLDSQSSPGDGIRALFGGLNSSTGTLGDGGYVMRITFEPVPEPTTVALVSLWLTIPLLYRRKRVAL